MLGLKIEKIIICVVVLIMVIGATISYVFVKNEYKQANNIVENISTLNTKTEISNLEKEAIEEYVNIILNREIAIKIQEFDDINNADKVWIYSHIDAVDDSHYITKEQIKKQLINTFGNNLILDVDNDIKAMDNIIFDKENDKYELLPYGMDNKVCYYINTVNKVDKEYIVNVIEYNKMSDLYADDIEDKDIIISAYDENITKSFKWKEIFRMDKDTSNLDIENEILKRKYEFQSYNITIIQNDEGLYNVIKIKEV